MNNTEIIGAKSVGKSGYGPVSISIGLRGVLPFIKIELSPQFIMAPAFLKVSINDFKCRGWRFSKVKPSPLERAPKIKYYDAQYNPYQIS